MTLKNLTLLISSLLLIIECAFSQTITTNPISLERKDSSLITYYLEIRNGNKHSKSLFVILQGSDCNSVSKIPAIDKLKAIYPDADILTIEKYGITDTLNYCSETRDSFPEGYIDFDNPIQRESDANMVIESLIKNFNYKKILVLGGSEGAIVAIMLASKYSYVNATITIGGGGRFFIDDVIHCMKFLDFSDEEKEKNIEEFKQFSEYILTQDSLKFTLSEHGFLYWKIMLSIDQQEIINKISTPLLILQGGKDESSSPEKATEMINELKKSGKDNIDYYYYPEYDHSLDLYKNENSSEEIINDIQKWVQKKIE